MVSTRFTDLVGCRHPVQLATMGGVSTPELAGAVAAAGGLGMLSGLAADSAAQRIDGAVALTPDGALGMGFLGPWLDHVIGDFELAASRLRVVEVFWRDPDPALVERARGCGDALVAWQVGSVEEARAAVDAGCDFVVAQGLEAGGHVRGTTPRAELLDQVLATVDVPVVTAGAIVTAADVAAAIDAGAAAVRVGTRFLASPEADIHPAYLQALLDASSPEDTALTTTFGSGWPDAPHRVLASCIAAATALDGRTAGEVALGDRSVPVEQYAVSPPTTATTGEIGAMALYAGAGAGDVHGVLPAADIVADLVSRIG